MFDHTNTGPFTLGGREDEEILSLFREWVHGKRAAAEIDDPSEDGDEIAAANDRLHDLTRDIAALLAQSVVGLTIKSYLAIHSEHGSYELGADLAGLCRLDPKVMGRGVHSIIAFSPRRRALRP